MWLLDPYLEASLLSHSEAISFSAADDYTEIIRVEEIIH